MANASELDGLRQCRCFFPLCVSRSSNADPAFWIFLRLQVTKFPGLRLGFLWLLLFRIHWSCWFRYAFTACQRTIRFVNCSSKSYRDALLASVESSRRGVRA